MVLLFRKVAIATEDSCKIKVRHSGIDYWSVLHMGTSSFQTPFVHLFGQPYNCSLHLQTYLSTSERGTVRQDEVHD